MTKSGWRPRLKNNVLTDEAVCYGLIMNSFLSFCMLSIFLVEVNLDFICPKTFLQNCPGFFRYFSFFLAKSSAAFLFSSVPRGVHIVLKPSVIPFMKL